METRRAGLLNQTLRAPSVVHKIVAWLSLVLHLQVVCGFWLGSEAYLLSFLIRSQKGRALIFRRALRIKNQAALQSLLFEAQVLRNCLLRSWLVRRFVEVDRFILQRPHELRVLRCRGHRHLTLVKVLCSIHQARALGALHLAKIQLLWLNLLRLARLGQTAEGCFEFRLAQKVITREFLNIGPVHAFGFDHFEPFFGIDALVEILADVAVRKSLLQLHLLVLAPVAGSLRHFNLLVVVLGDASSRRGCFDSSWSCAACLGGPDAASNLFDSVCVVGGNRSCQ